MGTLKKISAALMLLIVFCAFTAENDLAGHWKGNDNGDIGFLTLSDNGYSTFYFNGDTMGGESYNVDGLTCAMKYEVNENVTPKSIDFIIINKATDKELGRLIGVYKLLSADELRIAMSFGGNKVRPTDFSKDAITFSRVK